MAAYSCPLHHLLDTDLVTFSYHPLYRSHGDMIYDFRCIAAFIRRMSAPTLEELTLWVRNAFDLEINTVRCGHHLERFA